MASSDLILWGSQQSCWMATRNRKALNPVRWLVALLAAAFFGSVQGTTSFSGCVDDPLAHNADGYCDSYQNNEECEYDGGDCCECDCVDNDYYTCGENGYNCIDPSSSCYDDAATPGPTLLNSATSSSGPTPGPTPLDGATSLTEGCFVLNISDGYCDEDTNIADCLYDGGDCCECDCVDADYPCGDNGYICIDPSSSCYDPTPVPTPLDKATSSSEGCFVSNISDGYCDEDTNIADCLYDGGDCCECDCVDGDYPCGDNRYICVDPSSSCYVGTPGPSPLFGANSSSDEGGVDNPDEDNSDGVDDDGGGGAPVGAIVGGSVGGVALLAAVSIFLCLRRKGRRNPSDKLTPAAIIQYPQLVAPLAATAEVKQYPQLMGRPTHVIGDAPPKPHPPAFEHSDHDLGGRAPRHPPPPAHEDPDHRPALAAQNFASDLPPSVYGHATARQYPMRRV